MSLGRYVEPGIMKTSGFGGYEPSEVFTDKGINYSVLLGTISDGVVALVQVSSPDIESGRSRFYAGKFEVRSNGKSSPSIDRDRLLGLVSDESNRVGVRRLPSRLLELSGFSLDTPF